MKNNNQNYQTAFLAGIDPLVSTNKVKDCILKSHKGIVKIDTPQGRKKGFMFVHFENKEDLHSFIKYGKIQILNRDVVVKPFLKGKALKKYQEQESQRRLFIKKIPKNWTDEILYDSFSTFGKIDQAYVVRNPKTNKHRGFGYVITCTTELASHLAEQNIIEFDSHQLKVQLHSSKRKGKEKNIKTPQSN